MPPAELNEARVNSTVIRLIRGDITDLEVDAFVYYAQADLNLGAGFGGAIAVRGGPSIQKELDELGPLETGEVVASGAGNLKAEHIIHAVGPRFQELDVEEKLRATVRSCLRCAEEKGIQQLAFPLMGAGFYMIPPDLSARVMIDALVGHLDGDTGLTEVTICALDTPQYRTLQAALAVLG